MRVLAVYYTGLRMVLRSAGTLVACMQQRSTTAWYDA